jgi:hypothetical protein
MLSLAAFLLAASAQAPASAQFAAEAIRICVATRADPAAVGALARAEGWTVADPAAAPGTFSLVIRAKKKKGGDRTFVRNRAWTVEKGGTAFTAGLLDYPDEPRARSCVLAGWDLDFDAVDSAVRADSRIAGGDSIPNFPAKYYAVPTQQASLHYQRRDEGTRQLHVMSVMLRDD